MKRLKAVVKKPGEAPYITEIDEGLEALQKQVGGLIECVYELEKENINIWINEEGKILELDPNFIIYQGTDFIVGPAVFLGFAPETGETISLTEEQISKVMLYCASVWRF